MAASKKKTKTRSKAASARTTRKKAPATRKKAAGTRRKKSATSATTSKKKTARKTSRTPTSKKKTATGKRTTKKTPAPKAPAGKSSAPKAASSADEAKPDPKSKKTKKVATTGAKKTSRSKTKRGAEMGPQSVAAAASKAGADSQGYVFINGRRVRMISTKGITPAARKKVQAAQQAAEVAEKPKKLKTPLTKRELAHYQRLLLERRAELVGSLSSLEEQALNSGDGDTSHMPIHMADLGSDTYDQDLMLGLAEGERRHLREMDDALRRIQDRTYGVCELTGNPIPKARLEAKPWAKYTIEAARLLESGWQG